MLHYECRHEAVPLPSPQEDTTSAPYDLTIIVRPQPKTAYAPSQGLPAKDTKSGYLRNTEPQWTDQTVEAETTPPPVLVRTPKSDERTAANPLQALPSTYTSHVHRF